MESLQQLGKRLLSTILPSEPPIQINPVMGSPSLPPSSCSCSGHVKKQSNSQSHARESLTNHPPNATPPPTTISTSRPPAQPPTKSGLSTPTIQVPSPNSETDINIDLITHVPNQHTLNNWTRTADLTRDYETIRPDLSTKTVKPRPAHKPTVSPTEMQKFRVNRALLAQVAARNDYWWDERETESKRKEKGQGKENEKEGRTDYEGWKRDVKDDLFMLINEVAEAGAGKEKIKPVWKRCAERMREVEREGKRVGLSEVQQLISEVLEETGMRILCDEGRFKVLTEMGRLHRSLDTAADVTE